MARRTNPNREYASDTKVSVAQSQAEVQEILEAHGIVNFGIVRREGSAFLWFEYAGRPYKLDVRLSAKINDIEQARKAAWRQMLLLVKAKFIAIKSGIATIEEEFFGRTVMPDGQLLVAHAKEAIDKAIANRDFLQLTYDKNGKDNDH